jgi:hypothetical protein
MDEFLNSILKTLGQHGFPQKRVSLPTDKMYEAADNKGLSFNQVLALLKEQHGVEAQIGPDKIIFSQLRPEAPAGISQEDMLRQAQEMMAQMDPEELRKLQDMILNMDPEQKEEIMKKGRDLGII